MHTPKYDLFVCSPKHPSPELNQRVGTIMLKLYQMLRQRLNSQGFGNVIFDTMQHMSDVELTPDDIHALTIHPVFISEHYMTKALVLDPSHVVVRTFTAPWRIRPSMDAYAYANFGKPPVFHAMFVGNVNSGKTYVMNEFKLMLRDISADIELIECENGIKQHDFWDITTDPTEYAAYKERVKANGICIGGGPSYTLGIDDKIYHNTKI